MPTEAELAAVAKQAHFPQASLLIEIAEELAQARATHALMNSHHEGYAVILEELDELWEVCKRNTHKVPHGFNDSAFQAEQRRLDKRADMRREALQVAAMAIRRVRQVRTHEIQIKNFYS